MPKDPIPIVFKMYCDFSFLTIQSLKQMAQDPFGKGLGNLSMYFVWYFRYFFLKIATSLFSGVLVINLLPLSSKFTH